MWWAVTNVHNLGFSINNYIYSASRGSQNMNEAASREGKQEAEEKYPNGRVPRNKSKYWQ